MAGHVVIKKLEKTAPPQCLLDGMNLYKWEDGDTSSQKMLFKVDPDQFFLSATGEDTGKSPLVWDLVLISDVRGGKIPKEGKLFDSLTNLTESSELNEECSRCIVSRMDGITKLHFAYVYAESPEEAQVFSTAVNNLAYHLLDYHLPVSVYMRKHYIRLCLEANGRGQLPLKSINKFLMVPKNSKEIKNYLESSKAAVQEMEDGTHYIEVSEFTETIYINLVDTLLQNRGPDLDVLKQQCQIKARKQHLDPKEFANIINTQQRDPRLNDILYPRITPDQAMSIMEKYGNDTDRLTMKDLLQYLMSEDNMIIDPIVFDQSQDMGRPLNHYFINSSHNTYLNGHQLRSESITEMYAQVLLTGCRCVELDCWPRNDFEDIIITHGNTWCTKVPFKDVVETINEYAFIASEYPVILSIENHCNKYPKLISRMAEIFIDVFGDKLLSRPFDDYPLEPGVPLPPPDRLKRKIIIKDKIGVPKGATATLQRGATLQEVPEEPEIIKDDSSTSKEGSASTSTSKEGSATPKEGSVTPKEVDNSTSTRPADIPKNKLLGAQQRPSLFKESEGDAGGEEDRREREQEDDYSKWNNDLDAAPKKPPTLSTKMSSISEEDAPPSTEASKSTETTKSSEEQSPEATSKPPEKKENGTEEAAKDEKKKYERGEALGASPLTEILNYVTAISFNSFEYAEKMNCNYIMSSFGEEKGLNFIKSKPKEFVRYNVRQNSRVYPAGGSRMNSSNYMPQIYWNVGCQMVALNFQTSDMPMQVNYAKFEMNGGTGYICKPSVMVMDRGFNPFVQKKIEDVVPARLSIKVISGMFITNKKTDLMVEVEMYGLPADIVRRQFTKKRSPAPHPFWDEDYFVFRRILMPELALLRLVVFDSDHVLIGQRILPVNHMRAGFRHVTLRDRHNNPLGISSLFLHIKIEDYVPDEYEEFVIALENPLKFATLALEQLAMGTAAGEEDEFAEVDKPRDREERTSLPAITTSTKNTLEATDNPFQKRKESAPPELITKDIISVRPAIGAASAGNMDTLQRAKQAQTLPTSLADNTMPCLNEAKNRSKVDAFPHDSTIVIENPDFIKLLKRSAKARTDLSAKQEKALKKLQSDQAKALAKVSKSGQEDQIKEMEAAHKKQLSEVQETHQDQVRNLERQLKTEIHEKQRLILDITHSTQMKAIEKTQKQDLDQVTKEIVQELRRKKKDGNKKTQNKDWLRGIEQEVFGMGMQTRSELSNIHEREKQYFQKSVEKVVKAMEEEHAKEIAELDDKDDSAKL